MLVEIEVEFVGGGVDGLDFFGVGRGLSGGVGCDEEQNKNDFVLSLFGMISWRAV